MYLTYDRLQELHEIFDRIKRHYGPSKFIVEEAELVVYYDPDLYVYGEIDGSEISLNLGMCTNMKDAVGTLIHEYTHYLQSPTWYTRYSKKNSYDNNPYEIEANNVAKRDLHLFI